MTHPYDNMPGYRRWSRGVRGIPADQFDPVTWAVTPIAQGERVATAGSCFAGHVSRQLRDRTDAFFDAEPAHPLLSPDVAQAFGYGVYSARYGNIYGARQWRQLVERALGTFEPLEDAWPCAEGLVDPFRPTIQPVGFCSIDELRRDRAQHLGAVRYMLSTMNILVFTLGLAERWQSRQDGAVYPMCPGTVAGVFDPARHAFVQATVAETVDDLSAAWQAIRAINPRARMILTVSPVALAATAHDRHVVISNTVSKSILRLAADEASRLPGMEYFPSFEIIAGPHGAARYVAPDLRNVSAEGVSHVMDVFFRHYLPQLTAADTAVSAGAKFDGMATQRIIDRWCDEASLDQGD
jgi:hypothetical protein